MAHDYTYQACLASSLRAQWNLDEVLSAEQELDKADRQEQNLQPEGQQPNQQPGESSGGFVGSQGQDSGEYLQKDGNPESGFAEQGQGAPEQGDIERGIERSQDSDSDIEGSSDNS